MTALCYRNFKHPMPTRSLAFLLCPFQFHLFHKAFPHNTTSLCHTASHLEGTHSDVCCLQHLLKKMLQFIQPIPSNSFCTSRQHYIISILYYSSFHICRPCTPIFPAAKDCQIFLLYTHKPQDRTRHPKEISHPGIFTVHNGHQPRQRRTRRMKSVRGAEADVLTRFLSLPSWALNFSRCSSFACKVFY